VGGHVERRLNGHLQCVLDEPFFPHVGGDGRRPRELA
jgi:hypothetical protein